MSQRWRCIGIFKTHRKSTKVTKVRNLISLAAHFRRGVCLSRNDKIQLQFFACFPPFDRLISLEIVRNS